MHLERLEHSCSDAPADLQKVPLHRHAVGNRLAGHDHVNVRVRRVERSCDIVLVDAEHLREQQHRCADAAVHVELRVRLPSIWILIGTGGNSPGTEQEASRTSRNRRVQFGSSPAAIAPRSPDHEFLGIEAGGSRKQPPAAAMFDGDPGGVTRR